MSIIVRCKCGKQVFAADDKAGKQARCPHCQAVFMLPSPARDVRDPMSPVTRSKPPQKQWYMQAEDGQKFGPVARQQLDAWVAERRVTAGCYIWQDGDKEMRFAADVYPQLTDGAAPVMPEKKASRQQQHVKAMGTLVNLRIRNGVIVTVVLILALMLFALPYRRTVTLRIIRSSGPVQEMPWSSSHEYHSIVNPPQDFVEGQSSKQYSLDVPRLVLFLIADVAIGVVAGLFLPPNVLGDVVTKIQRKRSGR